VSPGTDDQSGLEEKPTWFLIAEKDLMVSPETQRFTAARMKSKVVSLPVDHTPLASKPDAVAGRGCRESGRLEGGRARQTLRYGPAETRKNRRVVRERGIYKFAPLAATTEGLYDELFDINAKGVYFTIQKALPLLNDGASIIINTSVRAKSAW